ncbi:hypothetical protein WJR50_09855 [Catalinimonas sp. 4WD22]|uniref:phenylacetate--CoA ligase family protein n=1 Tax=Catalinimonas locisalis TaxID=3133978 RepID=UPI003100E794
MLFRQFIDKQLRYNFYFYRRLRAIQAQENKTDKDLLELQNHKFLTLLKRAYQFSPFYRNLYDRYGVNIAQIQSVKDIDCLPQISKTDVRDHMDQIFIGRKFDRISAYTSGTTGNPTQVYRDYASIIEEGAYQWAYRMNLGHEPGMRTVVLRGNLHRNRKERFNRFTNTLALSSYHLNIKNAQWYYQKISDFKPNAILAYPSSVESLANLFTLLDRSLSIPFIFTSSETLYGHQRRKIEGVFNTKIADWYGNAERTIALRQREDHLYEEIPTYSVNRFYEDYVLSTSLINSSFPLINYRVDDTIQVHPQSLAKKRGKRLISRIQGRSDDILVLPDGTRIGLLWGAFDRIPHLLLAQIVQNDITNFKVNIVVSKKFSLEDERFLEEKLKEFVGHQALFTIHKVEEKDIIKSKAGKYKLVVNQFLKNENAPNQVLEV